MASHTSLQHKLRQQHNPLITKYLILVYIIRFNNQHLLDNIMKTNQPVQLSQKVQYLIQKISRTHWQVRNSKDFQLKLNFVEYVDISIDRIINIKNKSPSKPAIKNNQNEKPSQAKLYSAQRERLELERTVVEYQKKELEQKSQETQFETIKLKLANKELEMEKKGKVYEQERKENNEVLRQQKEKNYQLRQEIEKLIQLNRAQEQQNGKVKAQRKRAQKSYVQLKEKYYGELGQLQRLGQKHSRYLYRNTKGLRHTHTYANISNDKVKTQKMVILELPTILQALKIVYGIRIGIQTANREVLYYDKFEVYEKEAAHIQLEDENIVVTYNKRKLNNRIVLDMYKVHKPEIVVMLYGKGDSILVHDS